MSLNIYVYLAYGDQKQPFLLLSRASSNPLDSDIIFAKFSVSCGVKKINFRLCSPDLMFMEQNPLGAPSNILALQGVSSWSLVDPLETNNTTTYRTLQVKFVEKTTAPGHFRIFLQSTDGSCFFVIDPLTFDPKNIDIDT